MGDINLQRARIKFQCLGTLFGIMQESEVAGGMAFDIVDYELQPRIFNRSVHPPSLVTQNHITKWQFSNIIPFQL